MAQGQTAKPGEVAAPASPEAAPRAAPQAHQRWRAIGLRVLAGCAGVVLAALAIAIFGSASDGTPTVTIRLTQAPQSTSAANATPGAKSFLATRSIKGQVVADPELIEDSFEGPLPKMSATGRSPMAAYAMPIDRNDTRPKVAVVVMGLGVSAAATDLALKRLPPQVTLAFLPFAQKVQADVDAARGTGHEVLLQVPMEPFDFPESDPGPHALLVNAAKDENIRRLNWALSRFTGYVGFTNSFGARFLGEAGAIEPILVEAAKRGLIFFDTGASARSLSGTAARHAGTVIATGTLVLDDVQSASAIDDRLVQLEAQARRDGFAIGVGALYPVTVERVAAWAASANMRGIHIVPVSALAAKPDASATASIR